MQGPAPVRSHSGEILAITSKGAGPGGYHGCQTRAVLITSCWLFIQGRLVHLCKTL